MATDENPESDDLIVVSPLTVKSGMHRLERIRRHNLAGALRSILKATDGIVCLSCERQTEVDAALNAASESLRFFGGDSMDSDARAESISRFAERFATAFDAGDNTGIKEAVGFLMLEFGGMSEITPHKDIATKG